MWRCQSGQGLRFSVKSFYFNILNHTYSGGLRYRFKSKKKKKKLTTTWPRPHLMMTEKYMLILPETIVRDHCAWFAKVGTQNYNTKHDCPQNKCKLNKTKPVEVIRLQQNNCKIKKIQQWMLWRTHTTVDSLMNTYTNVSAWPLHLFKRSSLRTWLHNEDVFSH